jgi:hypothetical protein
VTLLTNDNNLAMKAEANGVVAISGTTDTNEPLSADLLIRQAVHGIFPPDHTYIRPKDGDDICMLDISGGIRDHLKFLPGLEASRFAPKSRANGDGNASQIAIDPDTGAVVLIKNGERSPTRGKYRYLKPDETVEETREVVEDMGETYADVMELEHSKEHSDDEMELD